MRTQSDRVLRHLKARGAEGTDQSMWYQPEDGGTAITRLAARINDLREQGWIITSHDQDGSKFKLYRLAAHQPNIAVQDPVPSPSPVVQQPTEAKKTPEAAPQLALPF